MHSLSVIVRIVEMNNSFLMCLYYILRKQDTVGYITANLTCHIVALYAVDGGVLVGVLLLDLLVVAFDQA